MTGRLQEKIAIVIGTGRGIGAGTAERFIAEGGMPLVSSVAAFSVL